MPLADNAYRLLGLPAQASQQEIYASAAAIRRALKLGVDGTTRQQLAWLGAANRTENDVRDALSRLADPAQRISERFYWFFYPYAITTELSFAALEESSTRLRGMAKPAVSHDIALQTLAALLQLDPTLIHTEEWRQTFSLWKEVIEANEFWSQVMAADLKGDFEQLVTFGEIKNLRAKAWRLVTTPVSEIAKDGLLHDDHKLTRRALDILRSPDLPQALTHEYESEILGTVEDKFEILFAETFRPYRHEVKSSQNLSERKLTCQLALAQFEEKIKPALKKFFELAGMESLATRRVFETAADGLDELADGFDTALDGVSKLKVLRKAWLLAPPDSASLLTIEDHLKAAGDLQVRPDKTDLEYIRQIKIALRREPAAQPELFKSFINKDASAETFKGCFTVIAKLLGGLLLMIIISKCVSNLPRSNNRYRSSRLSPLNYNVAMPRFSPPPLPELQNTSYVNHITPGYLQAKLTLKTATLVYVGTKNEYDAGHIPGAIFLTEEGIKAGSRRLPKYKSVVLYCSCYRQEASERAALELQTLGFTDVAVLDGGYQAWLTENLPVTRTK